MVGCFNLVFVFVTVVKFLLLFHDHKSIFTIRKKISIALGIKCKHGVILITIRTVHVLLIRRQWMLKIYLSISLRKVLSSVKLFPVVYGDSKSFFFGMLFDQDISSVIQAFIIFQSEYHLYWFEFSKVIKAKVLKRRETGPSQSDDVIYTVKIIQNYKVFS